MFLNNARWKISRLAVILKLIPSGDENLYIFSYWKRQRIHDARPYRLACTFNCIIRTLKVTSRYDVKNLFILFYVNMNTAVNRVL